MLLGKAVRLERILNRNTRRTVIVPMDHGVTVGPIKGMHDFKGSVDRVAEGGANAVLMHKGMPRCTHRGYGKDIGLIVHLSASTSLSPFPGAKTLVASVEDAIKLGADGVSVHVNLGDERERDMLADLGMVCSRAAEWGMPVLAMMYARGPHIVNEYDPAVVAHAARVAVELGADVVKCAYTGDMESFARVVEACCVPVVIAGGPRLDDDAALLTMAHDACLAGCAGLSIGRNVFQHDRPELLVKALSRVVHDEWDVERALEVVRSGRA
ncbi:phospho-2-dehydro-3-deoxyheptonate aldolase [Alkalidesulfovibrio alkalitolerans DSM 16529]|jgi:class I fructose-bisphosphate aldolase|uniref:2-amino-3,7-dideoxy-D-threo-hept-6-ulosonate synthase n=1 Tax=Alkalidesulfovibrio alkalitolerans DSM 16529 TaxID=1121439 RepID=S7TD50_9BACT|nr:2-amino-3,7-dideoxy-D-threo-hept-6-ulosonate synthase [Alkalidesulfovibrio alkalitolerans]EPR35117.1 phospho-2-dehydro-3-deoxyheptonate aldolase [Alkalidesulfovibrio alkalitolerans DSM 16529]